MGGRVPSTRRGAGSVTTYVGLLRAVNIGPHQRVGMEKLQRLAEGLGYRSVQTLLATGNLVFDGASESTEDVARRLEEGVARTFGLRTSVLVRTAAEISGVVSHNPFPEESRRDPAHLVVVFLRDEPTADRWDALRERVRGPEVVRAWGRHAFVHYAAGIGTSRLTAAVIDRSLETVGTGRNWNTVLKIATAAAR